MTMNTLLTLAADDQNGSRLLGFGLLGLAVSGYLVLILRMLKGWRTAKQKTLERKPPRLSYRVDYRAAARLFSPGYPKLDYITHDRRKN